MRGHPSFTSLQLFDYCPAAWQACYLRGEPAIVPDNVRRGKAIHRACELYAKHCKERRCETDFDAGRRLAAGLDGSAADDFTRWVENWAWEWSTVKATPIEGQLEALLPDGVTVFSGHPDLVQQVCGSASSFGEGDDLWVVTDFKSHFHGWPEDPPEQLMTYAWLTQRTWPDARDFSLVIVPLDGGPARQWAVGGDLSFVGERLQAKVDMIAAETEFEVHPVRCSSCFYRASCPKRDTKTVKFSSSDIETIACDGQWHAAQADLSRTLTKAHCQEYGPLPGLFEKTSAFGYQPENVATLATDLAPYHIEPTALRGSWDKAKIIRAAKQIEKANGGAEGFMALWRPTKPQERWGWVTTASKDEEDEDSE